MPYKAKIKKTKDESLAKYYLQATKHRAKAKGREFNLTTEDIECVLVKYCPILDVKLDYYAEYRTDNNTATVDRIDNSKGYIKGNIWIISNLANSMKRNATKRQLVKFAKWALDKYGK